MNQSVCTKCGINKPMFNDLCRSCIKTANNQKWSSEESTQKKKIDSTVFCSSCKKVPVEKSMGSICSLCINDKSEKETLGYQTHQITTALIRIEQAINHQTGSLINEFNSIKEFQKSQTEKIITVLERHEKFRPSKSSCFVATAAYKDPMHEDVIYLRFFRDNFLSRSSLGTLFVKLYWIIGPKLAYFVEKNTSLQSLSKFILSKLVKVLRIYFPNKH